MFRENSRKSFSAKVLAAISWLLLCASAQASQSVTLAWNAGLASSVSGYYLYYGTQSRAYSTRLDAGTNVQLTVNGLKEDLTYYFALTAYNAARVESALSGEVTYLVPGLVGFNPATNASSVPNIRFPVAPGHWYEIQASTDMKTWVTLWQTAIVTSNVWVQFRDPQWGVFPMRFYRLAGHLSSALPSPIPQSVVQGGGAVALTWNALPGQAYQVQYGTGPNPTNWTNLGNVVVASSSTETMPFAVNSGSQWSYRVLLAAPLTQPVFQSVSQADGAITFTWNSVPGQMYQVQYSTELQHPNWKNLGSVIDALDWTTTAGDAIGPDPQRFYRAVLVGTLPPPMIQSMARTNGNIVFSWNSVAGQVYQVQYTHSLVQPYWQNLGHAITAQGTVTTATDTTGLDQQRFYRVTLLASSPAPVIQSVTETNGMIAITWSTIPGQIYELDYTTSLYRPVWNYLEAYYASGYTMTVYDYPGWDVQRFYRVAEWH